jgi:multiple sugar transport system permease protein
MSYFLPFLLLVVGMTIFPCGFSWLTSGADFRAETVISLYKDEAFRLSMQVSSLYSLVVTLLIFFCGSVGGYLLSRLPKSSQRGAFFFLFIVWSLPSFVSIPLFRALLLLFCDSLVTHGITAFLAIVAARFWVELPIMTLITLTLFQNLPSSYEESMMLEGAGMVDRFFSLFFRVARQSLMGYLCFSWLNQLRDVTVPMMISEGRPLLVSGFTSYGIAGYTTTLGFFLKKNLTELSFSNYASFLWTQNMVITVSLLGCFWFINRMLNRPQRSFWLWIIMEILWNFSWGSLVFLPLLLFRNWHRKSNLWICAVFSLILALFIKSISPFSLILWFYLLLYELKAARFLKKVAFAFHTSLFTAWGVISIFAIVFFLWLSFSKFRYLPTLSLIFEEFGNLSLKNYAYLFKTGFSNNLFNSLLLGLFSGFSGVLVFSFAAYTAVRKPFFYTLGKGLISLTLVMAGMNTLVPLIMTLDRIGLLNRYTPIILTVLNQSAPIAFISSYIAFKQISLTYIESAQTDGASRWQLFRKIHFPLALPTLSIIFLYLFIRGWSSFISPLLMISKPEMFPVSLKLYDWAGNPGLQYTNWGVFAAGSLVTVSVMILCSIPLPRLVLTRWSPDS